MTNADDAVLDAVETTLLDPAIVERALSLTEAEIVDGGAARRRAPVVVDLAKLDTVIERLMIAIKRGGDISTPLLAALRRSEPRRAELRQQIAAIDAKPRIMTLDASAVRATLKSCIAD